MAEPQNEAREGLSPEPKPGHDPARARFWFIAAHRIVGAALVVLGMMAMQGVLDWSKGVGKALAIVGLIDFFVIPLVFARMWKSLPK